MLRALGLFFLFVQQTFQRVLSLIYLCEDNPMPHVIYEYFVSILKDKPTLRKLFASFVAKPSMFSSDGCFRNNHLMSFESSYISCSTIAVVKHQESQHCVQQIRTKQLTGTENIRQYFVKVHHFFTMLLPGCRGNIGLATLV